MARTGHDQVPMEEIEEFFQSMDLNNDGKLNDKELGELLKFCNEALPGYKLRECIEVYDTDKNGSISFQEFLKLYNDLLKGKVDFREKVKSAKGIESEQGTSEVSAAGTTHSFSKEETVAFTEYINSTDLKDDPDLQGVFPISPDNGLFKAVKDGVLLCKMINKSCPNTIDERVITVKKLTKFTCMENLTLALNSARAIGCSIINIDCNDLMEGTKHLVLGLVWQIIRIGLFANIDLRQVPGLVLLLEEGESLADLQKLSPEELLIRWVNYHLQQAGEPRRIKNFSSDIKDSYVYDILLRQIAPKEIKPNFGGFNASGTPEERAESVLCNADHLGCRAFVTAKDIAKGHAKLNMAFVANLFNHHPALEPQEEIEYEQYDETREEKTFRNWMNSLNVSPYVHHLYSDLCNGLVLLQLYDIVKKGTVNWNKVSKAEQLKKMGGNMKKIENCNYAVELGKKMNFSLVGVGGQDIRDGNVTLTLAVVWQLLRAYTLGILQNISGSDKPLADNEIVAWANEKLQSAGKDSRLQGFRDPAIAESYVILDLIDAVKPGSVNYSLYEESKGDEEIQLKNAQYTITVARKIGAMVYALPEDIVEVKHKMVMTVIACLMAKSLADERK